MKIVVTGGNGFLGSHIARELVSLGHEVISIQRSDPVIIQKQEGVDYIQADLTDPITFSPHFKGIDVVFHVAAYAGVWGPWDEFYASNFEATANVVEACKLHGIRKLIYTSTPSVVFSGASISGADESLPYGSNWLCHYAHSKQLAEAYVLSDEVARNLDVVAIRPHLIWGSGDPHLLPRLVERARDGGLRIVGDGKNRVDITHVSNATQAHLLALKQLIEHPDLVRQKAYFISDGEPVVLWHWIQELLKDLGIRRIRKRISYSMAYRIAWVLEVIYQRFRLRGEPPMTRFVAVELAKDHFFNISAAQRDLGYSPCHEESARSELIDYLKSL